MFCRKPPGAHARTTAIKPPLSRTDSKENNMKVLHIITSTNRGGAESHLLSLAGGQARLAGDTVCVVSLSPGADELDAAFARAGVKVVHIPLKNKYAPFGCVLRTREFIRKFQPDVVHSHLLPANIVGGLAARLSGTAHVAYRKSGWLRHSQSSRANNYVPIHTG